MTRLITKQMRDSFKVRLHEVASSYISMKKPEDKSITRYFEQTKKQRILILKRIIK